MDSEAMLSIQAFRALEGAETASSSPRVKAGTSALNGMAHLGTVAFGKVAGLDIAYVHFDGGGPALTALLGGHVDAAAAITGATSAHVKSGAKQVTK